MTMTVDADQLKASGGHSSHSLSFIGMQTLTMMIPRTAVSFSLIVLVFSFWTGLAASVVEAQEQAQQQQLCKEQSSGGDTANEQLLSSTTGSCVNPLVEKKDVVNDYSNEIDDEDDDPMLQPMPGYDNFKAYVRADISTFYRHVDQQEEHDVRKEQSPALKVQPCKFINMSPFTLSLFWNNHHGRVGGGIPKVVPWGAVGFPIPMDGSYTDFRFTQPNRPDQVFCRFSKIVPDTALYYCNPFVENDEHNPSQGEFVGRDDDDDDDDGPFFLPLEALSSATDRAYYDAHVTNLAFARDYKNFTGGTDWLAMYPYASPPQHFMWRADYFGQEHVVETSATHILDMGDEILQEDEDRAEAPLSIAEMRQSKHNNNNSTTATTTEQDTMNLTLKVLSCAPRVFEIDNFLSETEVDHLLDIVQANQEVALKQSTQNGQATSGRTSRTAWIPRELDAVLNRIYQRAADTLKLDESLLRHREPEEIFDRHVDLVQQQQQRQRGDDDSSTTSVYNVDDPINEHLQIVHYNIGQQFETHHDFGYPLPHQQYGDVVASGRGHGHGGSFPSRSINLALYLNDVPEGGQTSFPLWRHAAAADAAAAAAGHSTTTSGEGEALTVQPKKGKAVLFYMKTPDGNLDALSVHAGMPVLLGEKWFSNLWIHDPMRVQKKKQQKRY